MGEAPSDAEVRMACDCGDELTFSRTEDRVRCPCGRHYAVTITRISAPEQ